jgi:hypothetical protein
VVEVTHEHAFTNKIIVECYLLEMMPLSSKALFYIYVDDGFN